MLEPSFILNFKITSTTLAYLLPKIQTKRLAPLTCLASLEGFFDRCRTVFNDEDFLDSRRFSQSGHNGMCHVGDCVAVTLGGVKFNLPRPRFFR